MIILQDSHIREIGIDWPALVGMIEDVVRLDDAGQTVHPLKTYLRYEDLANRIIAMPAYVGGETPMAGIKWVASFPGNNRLGLPRAHNSIILNDPATGEPLAYMHVGLLNGLRASAVSGLMLRTYIQARQPEEVRLGIIGWGPIGRLHLDMAAALLGDRLKQVTLFDLKGVSLDTVPVALRGITVLASDWKTLYRDSHVVATCTVAAERYIDEAPPAGSLQLNVSLRDYVPEAVNGLKTIVVDDWHEVCRENTDIEHLHLRYGLQESDALTLADVVCRDAIAGLPLDEPIFFNPMGLGVFDIAFAGHYWRKAKELVLGIVVG